MNTEDLFKTNDQEVDNALEALVGDGKKFKDAEALAKAKLESDRFIKQLEQEKAQLLEDLKGRMKLEQLMDKLDKAPIVNTGTDQNTKSEEKSTENKESQKGLTLEDVEQLLSKKEQEIRQKTNVETVAQKMKEMFGDNFQEHVNNRAKDLDLDVSYLADLAKNRPTAFLNLMKTEQKTSAKTNSDNLLFSHAMNTAGMNNTKLPKKFSDFSKLRKEDPVKFYSAPVQQEIYKLTQEYGSDFLNS